MSTSPRWMKLWRDLWTERGRVALMITAVAVSLVAVGAVLGAYAILTREMTASYLGTKPASATLELPGGVKHTVVAAVREHPAVAEAEAREVVLARARVRDEWRRMLLFVIDDFGDIRLNRFRAESGAWPPPEGTMLVERSAVSMLNASTGQTVLVKTPHGAPRELLVSGLVHDPGLAPAWQERSGYGYITRDTLAALGEPPILSELRIELRDPSLHTAGIEASAAEVATWLSARGHSVHEIRIPPPKQHPHQRQMTTVLVMMLAFGVMALVLSAILAATSLAALLARQVREIGVMKAVGARGAQIAGLYAVLVSGVGVAAVLLSLPLSVLGALTLAGAVSSMLNFDLASRSIPAWVFLIQALAGVLVPLALAAIPIRRASRISVRQAMDDHGVAAEPSRTRLAWLPTPLRNAMRRPARLALTLGLLATGGAMFIMALNIKDGWQAIVARVYETRSYHVEVRLQTPEPAALARRVASLEGVEQVEAWGYTPAAFSAPGKIDVVHTYPDRGHGSMAVMGPPADTRLVSYPLQAGRWLTPDDTDAVVLNHVARAQAPTLRLGDQVALSIGGHPRQFRLVGIVEEIGSPAVAYVTRSALAGALGTGGGSGMLRIKTSARSPEERTRLIRTLDRELAGRGVGVESIVPLSELRTAMGDHILILIRSLMAMAAILAVVGMLGLTATMGVSVVERTRELAVMKVIGATPARIVRQLVQEGVLIGLASWVLALALSIPLTSLVGAIVGSMGFLAPLPLVFSPVAAVGWLLLVSTASLAATTIPARRAAATGIREALAQT